MKRAKLSSADNSWEQDMPPEATFLNDTKRKNSKLMRKAERRKWTHKEDAKLSMLIKQYGTSNWKAVASMLPDRSSKQCRERWINHLDPNIVKGKLTPDEWNIVVQYQGEFGNRWSEIAKHLPGRTPNQIKNVWHAFSRRKGTSRGMLPYPPVSEDSNSDEEFILNEPNTSSDSDSDKNNKLDPSKNPANMPFKLQALITIALDELYGLDEVKEEEGLPISATTTTQHPTPEHRSIQYLHNDQRSIQDHHQTNFYITDQRSSIQDPHQTNFYTTDQRSSIQDHHQTNFYTTDQQLPTNEILHPSKEPHFDDHFKGLHQSRQERCSFG
jgi:hypothetical protein